MLPFTLIGQPDYAAAVKHLGPARNLDLLVLYHGELNRRAFLGKILKAAGYTEPGEQLHLLEWPVTEPLDLTALVRKLGVNSVLLFGYELTALGLHFTAPNYVAVEIAGIHYLLADSLEYIEQTKTDGDSRAAGALWNAVKENFLKEKS